MKQLKKIKTSIISILDRKARRVFAKKELGITDEQVNEIEEEELALDNFDPDVNYLLT